VENRRKILNFFELYSRFAPGISYNAVNVAASHEAVQKEGVLPHGGKEIISR
jgi:hypothetical protein